MAKTSKKSLLTAEITSLRTQGILAIIFGAVTVFWPDVTIKTLGYLVGAFLLADGVVLLIGGLMNLDRLSKVSWILALGALELGFGVYLFHNPSLVLHTLIWLLGLALIARGLFSFMYLFIRELPSTTRLLHMLLGALGLFVGLIIVGQPASSSVSFVWIIGLYALLSGPMLIAMASDLQKVR